MIQDSVRWSTNGGSNVNISDVLTFSGAGGSLIDLPAISGANSSDHEVKSTLAGLSSGSTFIHFHRASSGTVQAGSGSYVSVELAVPFPFTGLGPATLNINQSVSGSVATLGSATVTASAGMVLRTVIWGTSLWVYINDAQVWTGTVTASTGNPGVGGSGMPAGTGFVSVALGHHDVVVPTSVDRTNLRSGSTPTQVLLQWAGVTDDANGVGLWGYVLSRLDPATGLYSQVQTVFQADSADNSVQAATQYSYSLSAVDYHGNVSVPLLFTVTTPPAQAVDPRRTGLKTSGVYWGGGAEQVDMLSGNVHFSIPLIRPQGRTGWTVPVDLIYDSQFWRQDAGTNWRFGYMQGFGLGWKIQIGSVTPYYTQWYNGADHYVFTDNTGAEYRLDVNTNGIWSSTESIYVWFDANANQLHFKDGSFWVMGSTSGGLNKDAGSLYPTVIEDSNGNQVLVSYVAGAGLPAGQTNTSSKIATIEDVRGKGFPSYTFTYGPVGVTITNSIGTPEAWTLNYGSIPAMNPPFGADGVAWGGATSLASVTGAMGTSHTFTYDASGSGELTRVDFPDGGHIRWVYGTATYSGSRLLREVVQRYVANSGSAAEWGPYAFTHDDSGNTNPTIHANTTLLDASGVGAKTWKFTLPDGNAGHAWKVGLVSDFLQKASAAGSAAVLTHDSYVWSQNSSSVPYVSGSTTVLDEGTASAKTMSATMTVDGYGNSLSQSVTDYAGALARTWTSTYLHAGNTTYANAYLRNRVVSSTIADYTGGGHSVTLATNTYDAGSPAWVNSATEFDGVQGAISNHVRGNVTQTVSMGTTATVTYDATGQALTGTDATGSGSSATYTSVTNNAAAAVGAPMAGTADVQNSHSVTQVAGSMLSSSYGYNSALSLVSSTMPNGAASSQVFSPSTGLLTSSVSVHGATTSYTYTFNPTMVTATTNGHWSKAYKDGFGRDLAVESGYGSTIVSRVDNVYGPCACSPLGKVVSTSQPYAVGAGGAVTASDGTANIAWTTFVYDGLGRTVSSTAADGSVTGYLYSGNTTKVTDPAGNWKRYTNDSLGNLATVEEPNPANGQADSAATNFSTGYTYDLLGHMTQVSMPRPNGGGSYTQTRAFNYDLPTGHLLSTVNPENGTTTYTYYASGRLKTKVDAKGQKVSYSYDGYGRVAFIDRAPNGVTTDVCQSVALTYDLSSAKGLGRLTKAVTGNTVTCGQASTETFTYTSGGLVTGKGFHIDGQTQQADYPYGFMPWDFGKTENYSWNQEGRMTGYGPFAYGLDAMGRPVSLAEGATLWVQNAVYGPGGEMKQLQYRTGGGTYYTETHTFNKRGQMVQQQTSGSGLQGMNLAYVYTAGANNGQIAQLNDLLSGEQVAYTYDSLKRLVKAETTQAGGTQWGQSFGYDGFGNLVTKNPTAGHTGTTMALSVSAATNRVTTAGFGYDANGNAVSIAASPQNIALTYDVENRTGGVPYDQQNQPLLRDGVWNLYGLRGERLETHTYLRTVYPIYDDMGNLTTDEYVGVSDTATRNVYFGGRLIQSKGQTVVTDRLGSVRVNEAGEKAAYYPYGEQLGGAMGNGREKFATYTRETNGLDYARQRYYASTYGRFTQADPSYANVELPNPASWNLYSYVNGDPANFNDPSGLGFWSGVWNAIKSTVTGSPSPGTTSAGGGSSKDHAEADEFDGDQCDGDACGGVPTFKATGYACPGILVWSEFLNACDVPFTVNWAFMNAMRQNLQYFDIGLQLSLRVSNAAMPINIQTGSTYRVSPSTGVSVTPSNIVRASVPLGAGTLAPGMSTDGGSYRLGLPVGTGVAMDTCGRFAVTAGIGNSGQGYIDISAGYYINIGCGNKR